MTEGTTDAFERGVKEGRLEARLASHDEHFEKINGSIERFAVANEDLVTAMRELASEIRTLQEGGRLAQERVKVAADTLAKETERRREDLAATAAARAENDSSSDRSFTRRERLAGLTLAFTGLLISLYFYIH